MRINKTDIRKKMSELWVEGLAVILFFAAMIVLNIRCRMDTSAIASAFAADCTGFIAAVIPVMRSRLKENGQRQNRQIGCE